MNELNGRQWRLYELLKARADKWTKQQEIARELSEFYPTEDGASFHDSRARLLMTRDIREINERGIIQKIIISSPKGVKLANKEEARRFIAGKYSAVFARLERVRTLERKAGLDGQARLIFGRERGVIEAFTDSGGGSDRTAFSFCENRVKM